MSDYGIQPTGFVRKPLSVILAEIEAAMITEFGPDVIQTSQSPFGQLNGLMADLISEAWERNEELYQSYDPDQAEGNRLDILARLRLVNRGIEKDEDFRKSITNEGQSRVDIQDLSRAIKSLDGVTYSQVFVNETGEVTNYGLERGSVAIAIIGGNNEEIAKTMRKFIAPGINTYGNTHVTSNIDGYCRSSSIIRPIIVPVTLTINLKATKDKFGCPAPSPTTVKAHIVEEWNKSRINGLDPTFFTIRSIIEGTFSNLEVLNVIGERDDLEYPSNSPVPIGFIEIAEFSEDDTTVIIT